MERELVEFKVGKTETVESWLTDVIATADGKQWINLEPIVPDEQLGQFADRRGVSGWFSSRGSDLPFATVVGPNQHGRKPKPTSIGLTHGSGPKAVRRLADHEVAHPSSWRLKQDNPKRGLVFEADNPAATEILDYVLTASRLLSSLPLDGWWSAVRYRR